jgi:hypothetical protein
MLRLALKLYSVLTLVTFTVCPSTPEPSFNYGGSYLRNSVQAFQQQVNAAGSPRDKLQQYLKSGVETTTNIPGWWGVSKYSHKHAHMSNRTSRSPDTPL